MLIDILVMFLTDFFEKDNFKNENKSMKVDPACRVSGINTVAATRGNNPSKRFKVHWQVKINKKIQREIVVNIFVPIILTYVLGAQKNRLIAGSLSYHWTAGKKLFRCESNFVSWVVIHSLNYSQ